MDASLSISVDEEIDPMRHPPYHLRTNKSVDRLLLVDVLRACEEKDENLVYYSLAGPFLEDLRVMDHFFPRMRLVSLESNEQTFKRQKFNQFSSRLELKNETLEHFLTHDYTPGVRDVFWLDYTDLKYSRFEEFQRVLKQVRPGSIVRITLRAEPEIDLGALKERVSDEELARIRAELEKKFKDEFDRVLPHPYEPEAFVSPKVFAQMVQLMVRRAASTAVDKAGSSVNYFPIQSTYYDDHTQMISITGMVCLRSKMKSTIRRMKTRLDRFANFDWHEPERLDIPALSLKERLQLERYLPIPSGQDAGEVLFDALQYMIDNGEAKSKRQLSHYADCHREYPNFVRISI